jgi:hypothetical protein
MWNAALQDRPDELHFGGVVRLVTSFATEQADVDDLLAVARAVAAQ